MRQGDGRALHSRMAYEIPANAMRAMSVQMTIRVTLRGH
jgi:hypothetical protein